MTDPSPRPGARPSLDPELLAFVIVDHRTPHTATALATAISHQVPGAEIVVVENGPEPIAATVASSGGFRAMHVANRGYGAGVNEGVAATSAPILIIANPDLDAPSALVVERMVQELADESVGAVGPTFLRPDGQPEPGTSSDLPSVADSFRRAARRRALPPGRHEVANLTGALLVMRRETWEQVGGFDEGYFLYFEDADLCTRLGRAGFRLIRSDAQVVHAVGAAPAPAGARAVWSRDSQRRYFRTWRPRWEQALLPALRWIGDQRLRWGSPGSGVST